MKNKITLSKKEEANRSSFYCKNNKEYIKGIIMSVIGNHVELVGRPDGLKYEIHCKFYTSRFELVYFIFCASVSEKNKDLVAITPKLIIGKQDAFLAYYKKIKNKLSINSN